MERTQLIIPMLIAFSFRGAFGHFEEQKMTDVKTLWRPDGTAQVNYTDNGQSYTLELVENKISLSAVPVWFATNSEHHETEATLKHLRLMKDQKSGSSLIFNEVEGKLELVGKVGGLQKREHSQNMKAFTTLKNPARNFDIRHAHQELTKTLGRKRRSNPATLTLQKISGTIELVWIADFSVFNTFKPLQIPSMNESSIAMSLLIYYAHMTSMMNDSFKTLQNDYLEVSISLAGIYILDSPTAAPSLIDDLISSEELDGKVMLDRLSNWVTSTAGIEALPSYHHVMLSTLYDIKGGTGQAYKGGICNRKLSVSIVEAAGTITWNALAAIRNLATSLGADEDGVGSASECSDNKYLMGNNFEVLGLRFLFSCCSQRAFYGTMHRKGECLLEFNASYKNPTNVDQSVSQFKPGEIFTADMQCKLAYGTENCDDYSHTNTNLCKRLYCTDPSNSSRCISTEAPVADGTWCEPSKWCLQGTCTANTVSLLSSYQSCDVSECYGEEGKCLNGMNRFYPELNQCYDKQLDCEGVRDCSDGTDENNCDFVPSLNCSTDEWACTDGINIREKASSDDRHCVKQLNICDGEENCSDGSDEKGCGSESFCHLCYNNLCITSPSWCETLCPFEIFECQQYFYLIGSGSQPTCCRCLTFLAVLIVSVFSLQSYF